MRRIHRVMTYAIDRRPVLIDSSPRDLPARVAVAIKAWKVATGNLQPDAMARQKHMGCGPQIEPDLIDRVRFEQFRFRE